MSFFNLKNSKISKHLYSEVPNKHTPPPNSSTPLQICARCMKKYAHTQLNGSTPLHFYKAFFMYITVEVGVEGGLSHFIPLLILHLHSLLCFAILFPTWPHNTPT